MYRLPAFSLQVFLVSLGALLLEVSYTRIFSFKLFYYFAFMVIGFALLGIGSGGVAVAVSRRLREMPIATVVRIGSLAAALATVAGFVVIAALPTAALSMAQSAGEVLRMSALCGALFAVFYAIGTVLAALFSASGPALATLYAVDLMGAAAGCALAIPAMNLLTPPGTVMAAAAAFALASLSTPGTIAPTASRSASEGRAARAFALATTACCTVLALVPGLLPDIRTDAIKHLHTTGGSAQKTLWTRWSPIFRIDVVDPPAAVGQAGERLVIIHDGLLGSTLQRFDGDFSALDRFDADARVLPFVVAPAAPRVLVIGSAGGHEILASLHYGAREVTGVELNPQTVQLLRGPFADYTGRIAFDPRVRIVNAEGRAFMAQRCSNYDVVFFVAPDSYAAMNAAASGAFVLSESYLYTAEAIGEAIDALTPNGVVCMQFGEFHFDAKPNRTLRYLASLRAAFEARGITDAARHVLVAVSRGGNSDSTILVSRKPFDEPAVQAFLARNALLSNSAVVYAGPGRDADPRLRAVLEAHDAELEAFYDSYPYDVTAVSDDAPFFWHFARFADVLAGRQDAARRLPDIEDSVGERVLLRMLAVAAAFAVVFLLLPFVAMPAVWRKLPRKADGVAFFAAIGLGFMFLEISLIQRLTLLVGYPTYSLAVTLMTILLSTGIGSALSARWRTGARSVAELVAGIVACVAFYTWGLPAVVTALAGALDAAKIAAAIAVVAPLGVLLGAFMPLGLEAVAALSTHQRSYVAWAWAVNGFFSVLSSVLSTILSMSFGFTVVAWTAVAFYAIAAAALTRLRAAA